ncbi:hypothetical protein [Aliikangiella sp. IMCC44359]|uniref:hypothetical protein n=1 Tax=Aliikangiella sp. IMCC44359 TaxID=3459125 RepID=UPI00403B1209
METFLINISSFPTIIYSIALVVAIGYWLLVLLGLFDFDLIDIDADTEIDVGVDIDVDTDINQAGTVAGFLTTLGLTGVPITVVISLLLLNGWFICYFISELIPQFPNIIKLLQVLIQVGVVIISFMLALPVTAAIIKPLRPLFRKINQEPISTSLIGRTCRIRSSRVDTEFGEAECLHHGASLIIKVRTLGDTKLITGDLAIPIEYSAENGTYFVVPEKEFKNQI